MANHSATKKHVRASQKRREHNNYYGKTTRNAIRNLERETDKSTAEKALPEVISMIDKISKNNIIHKNKAAHLKAKLTKKVAAL